MYWTHWTNCAKTPGPCICPMYRKWPEEDKEMKAATLTCNTCGKNIRRDRSGNFVEHICYRPPCSSCNGYAHDAGKCDHPGCACETETREPFR